MEELTATPHMGQVSGGPEQSKERGGEWIWRENPIHAIVLLASS